MAKRRKAPRYKKGTLSSELSPKLECSDVKAQCFLWGSCFKSLLGLGTEVRWSQ